jgi:hypothetical protein
MNSLFYRIEARLMLVYCTSNSDDMIGIVGNGYPLFLSNGILLISNVQPSARQERQMLYWWCSFPNGE